MRLSHSQSANCSGIELPTLSLPLAFSSQLCIGTLQPIVQLSQQSMSSRPEAVLQFIR